MSNQTEIRHVIGAKGTLVLRTVSGHIRLTANDANEAVVIARSGGGGQPDLTVEREVDRLLIEPARRPGLSIMRRQDVAIDFDVTLPRAANVELKSVSADIAGTGLAGDQEYKTVSGGVRLGGAAGRLTIQTVSGDIRLDAGRQFELDAMTTSGDVTIEGELIDYLRVKTVSGDVRIAGRLGDGPRHSVATVSGDLVLRSTGGVTVEPARALDIGRSARSPIVIGDGAAQLSFRSMSGEERVTGPAGDKRETATAYDQPAAPSTRAAGNATRLDVLRALERGDIDVEEAARRLEGVSVDA